MKTMKKLAFAVVAAISLSGCASNQVSEGAGPDAAPAQVAERKVSRALPSYGSMGGYRYRRFGTATAS